VLKRHSIYSPTMVLLIFMDLIGLMLETYISKEYHMARLQLMSNYCRKMFKYEDFARGEWLGEVMVSMLQDEWTMFTSLMDRHVMMQRNKS